jgi:hypothetical protein
MRLVKLHGSISWLRRIKDGQVIETEYNLDASETIGKGSLYEDEIMMYPLLENQDTYPHIEGFGRFAYLAFTFGMFHILLGQNSVQILRCSMDCQRL